MILARNTPDSISVEVCGGWVIKRIDRPAWEAYWKMDLDEQMTARVIESRRWPLVAPLFWFPWHNALVHRFVHGVRASLEQLESYIYMLCVQGRWYLKDVSMANLVARPDGSLCLIDFWIDLARWRNGT